VQLAAADKKILLLTRTIPGIKVRKDKNRLVVFYTEPAPASETPNFPVGVASCLTASLASLFKGTGYEKHARRSREILLSQMRRRAEWEDLDRKFWFLARGGEKSLADREEDLGDVVEAILKNRCLTFRYTNLKGQERDTTAEPLTLVLHEHQFYVLARHAGRTGFYVYRFSRMQDINLGDEFSYPTAADYHPEQHFADSLGIFAGDAFPVEQVEFVLSGDLLNYSDSHHWHPSQSVRHAPEGSVVELQVRNSFDLESMLLSLGEFAEVRRPTALRERLARRIHAAAAKYPEVQTHAEAGPSSMPVSLSGEK
jgi:predicted DNA-binding transcriptional regulator YafY